MGRSLSGFWVQSGLRAAVRLQASHQRILRVWTSMRKGWRWDTKEPYPVRDHRNIVWTVSWTPQILKKKSTLFQGTSEVLPRTRGVEAAETHATFLHNAPLWQATTVDGNKNIQTDFIGSKCSATVVQKEDLQGKKTNTGELNSKSKKLKQTLQLQFTCKLLLQLVEWKEIAF